MAQEKGTPDILELTDTDIIQKGSLTDKNAAEDFDSSFEKELEDLFAEDGDSDSEEVQDIDLSDLGDDFGLDDDDPVTSDSSRPTPEETEELLDDLGDLDSGDDIDSLLGEVEQGDMSTPEPEMHSAAPAEDDSFGELDDLLEEATPAEDNTTDDDDIDLSGLDDLLDDLEGHPATRAAESDKPRNQEPPSLPDEDKIFEDAAADMDAAMPELGDDFDGLDDELGDDLGGDEDLLDNELNSPLSSPEAETLDDDLFAEDKPAATPNADFLDAAAPVAAPAAAAVASAEALQPLNEAQDSMKAELKELRQRLEAHEERLEVLDESSRNIESKAPSSELDRLNALYAEMEKRLGGVEQLIGEKLEKTLDERFATLEKSIADAPAPEVPAETLEGLKAEIKSELLDELVGTLKTALREEIDDLRSELESQLAEALKAELQPALISELETQLETAVPSAAARIIREEIAELAKSLS
ncbi:hypothetical protein LWC08_10890 [Desulfobaculum bizertense]|uniref:hypothetical protein n=1 Tax=Desulfobaculum bizertense TaxID=376490 RepID=UPI001F46FE90|nr:hypothetical protein [Desulfobaculum bizertense]UIJ37237.1 hypothetical protein LWC08_10890 [Desulfobaculum bizertense]